MSDWRGTSIAGTVLAAILGSGLGIRTVARCSGISERELGRHVRRGQRARLRRGDQREEWLEGLLMLQTVTCALACREGTVDASRVVWATLGCLEAYGWSVEPLASVLRPFRPPPLWNGAR